MSHNLALLRANLDPARIGFVKFILEGYDGLAVLSTVDRTSGEITLRFHPARRQTLLQLLDELRVNCAGREPILVKNLL